MPLNYEKEFCEALNRIFDEQHRSGPKVQVDVAQALELEQQAIICDLSGKSFYRNSVKELVKRDLAQAGLSPDDDALVEHYAKIYFASRDMVDFAMRDISGLYQVILTTAPLTTPMNGDVDYTTGLAAALDRRGIDVCYGYAMNGDIGLFYKYLKDQVIPTSVDYYDGAGEELASHLDRFTAYMDDFSVYEQLSLQEYERARQELMEGGLHWRTDAYPKSERLSTIAARFTPSTPSYDVPVTLRQLEDTYKAGLGYMRAQHLVMKADRMGHSVIHMQVRPPNGGSSIPPERWVRADNISYVVTLHEFRDLKPEFQSECIEYAKASDHVIFTTEIEREAFLAHLRDKGMGELHQRFSSSGATSMVPIFPTLPKLADDDQTKRPFDIINFGGIRSGKGHASVLELARQIDGELKDPASELSRLLRLHQPDNPTMKVRVVGSVNNAAIVKMLMTAKYDLTREELKLFPGKTGDQAAQKIAELIERKKQEALADPSMDKLPVLEICPSAGQEELKALFESSAFAYMPLERGATHHSTAIPSVMRNGCMTLTHHSDATPKELGGGLDYLNRPVKGRGVVFTNGATIAANASPKDNASVALREIKRLIGAPKQCREIRKKGMAYAEGISDEKAAQQLEGIYQAVYRAKVRELALKIAEDFNYEPVRYGITDLSHIHRIHLLQEKLPEEWQARQEELRAKRPASLTESPSQAFFDRLNANRQSPDRSMTR